MIFDFSKIEKKIGYKFKNVTYLKTAFTHASYGNRYKEENNERFEFLGDSVLGLVVADYLFKSSYKVEGKMTEEKKAYVSKFPLSKACKLLNIDKFLLVDEGVEVSVDLQENLIESLICAIYLDGGIEPAKKFIYDNIINKFDIIGGIKSKDYKSELNELSTKRKFEVEYQDVKKTGLDNNPKFTVRLLINGKKIAEATASGKKQKAEQLVAKKGVEYVLKNKSNGKKIC